MSISKAEINQSLVEVRKAYRLLHGYQRAALDAAKYIGTQLGLVYHGGTANFSDCTPRNGKGLLECWAWDWLNMVFYDFTFRSAPETGDDFGFAIWLFSDTGYFIGNDSVDDKTVVASFADVEDCGTKVGFLFFRKWDQKFDGFRYNRTEVRHYLENDGELPAKLRDAGIVGKCCDFSRLADESSTNMVVDELIRFAQSNGFSLNRITKAA